MVVARDGSQEIMYLGFMPFNARRHGVPGILRGIILPDGLDFLLPGYHWVIPAATDFL